MDHISSLLNTASISINREEKKYNTALDPHITEIVNKLFVFFYSICRGFEKQYHDPKRLNLEKTQWIKAFSDVNLNTLEKIQVGVKKCRLESPINTPTMGQFIKWCTPSHEDIGLPNLEKAYDISIRINRQFSDYQPDCHKTYSVIKHAINQIGSSQYRSMSAENAFKAFTRYYAISCSQFVEGKLSEMPAMISQETYEHPNDKVKSNEARLKAMEAMRGMGLQITIKDKPKDE